MIKIGIECESIEETQTWGVARGINKLLEELSRRPELGNEFKFFLYFKARIPDYPYLASPLFVKKIVRPPFLPRSFSIYYYLLLPIKLWFEGLDMMYFPNYMLPLISRGKSLTALTEDVYYEMKGTLPFRYKLAYRIFSNWAARHATRIMAISESSKKALSEVFKISPARITVNHLGVTTTAISDWRLAIGDYLLYVGQALPRRHLRETILAFEKILPEFPELKLVTIGADKYNPPVIENLVAQVNQRAGSKVVVHHDYVGDDELAALYANAKALVYVSDREAFGLPPLEALSYGIVPIVAEAEVNREIYGDNAFFVKNGNSIDTIATAMKTALANKAKIEQIKLAAPEILKRYTWKAHTDRFLEIIRGTTNA
ncbi:MAG: glycosyltransferase family 1 protein [Patescibacteria group bacterium]